ncbi:MAG TPA: hypothetical protein VFG86_08795, partial [Chloroflexota bacterium]|nr:hypothetical protein [Chloroflexota bacterium]
MWVTLDVDSSSISVDVDGAQHHVDAAPGSVWIGAAFEQPGPLVREYQIDGSDTTSTMDRQPTVIMRLLDSPLYRFDSWLRDEPSFSRWEHVRILDAATGQPAPTVRGQTDSPGGTRFEQYFVDRPERLRIEAALRRPESAARLWLLDAGGQQGLELDRDRRNARWIIHRAGQTQALPRWFFPEQPLPFVAELLHLLGRTAAAAFVLAAACFAVARAGRVVARLGRPGVRLVDFRFPIRVRSRSLPARHIALLSLIAKRHGDRHVQAEKRHTNRHVDVTFSADSGDAVAGQLILALWLLAAALITTRLYHQLPHILDAVSYTFQAGVLRSGRLWLAPPNLVDAFRGPFQVVSNGHWFSQYPPGAPLAYALGDLAGLEWLVGPIACVVLIGATAWSANALHGRGMGYVVLLLGVLSPFILFQAGSFLSHPIAGGLLAAALAAYVKAERERDERWYGVSGALVGGAFLTREAASVLFALPLLGRLMTTKRWGALTRLVLCGIPFALVYVFYNAQLTGSPFLLPRSLFDASDRFGFGDGIGFHQRHTLGAGLANTDELLTLLQFDLFGWPPPFGLAVLVLPFLFGRAKMWDVLAGCGVLAFVAAYVAYFYHGIALGPRYYFEGLPWLLLLGGRGVVVLAEAAHSRVAAGVAIALLSLNTLLFYAPAE